MLSWTIIWKVWNRQENSGNSTRFSPLARFYLHLPLFAPMILTTLPTSFSTPKQAYSISSLPKKWIASWKRHAQKGDRKYEPNSIRKWFGFLFESQGIVTTSQICRHVRITLLKQRCTPPFKMSFLKNSPTAAVRLSSATRQ